MTVFPVGEDSLMLCSRCYAVVTQPWHDKLRETADALSEAQRENEELRDLAGRRATVLAFFRSVIHCGEGWTDRCQTEYKAAMEDRAIREARRGE